MRKLEYPAQYALLLIQNLFCHSIYSVSVDRFENDFFWLEIQQKLHVRRKSQQLTVPADIIVTELDDLFDSVFFRMLQDGLSTFGLCGPCLHFKRNAFAFHADKKVQLQAGVLLKVV